MALSQKNWNTKWKSGESIRCVTSCTTVTLAANATEKMVHLKFVVSAHAGLTPVRVFFHVDYKPKTAGEGGRKVGKDDMSTLSAQLDVLSERIRDISREIEHARKQEIDMKQAGGNIVHAH